MNNREIKTRALRALEGRYLEMFLILVVLGVASNIIGFYFFSQINSEQLESHHFIFKWPFMLGSVSALSFYVLVTGPLNVGICSYSLDMISGPKNNDKFSLITSGFRKNYGNIIVTYLLEFIFLFLWFLLFIIPGIIKLFSYAMVPFILAEKRDITPLAAITKSREMMDGNKARLFFLLLGFIGWFLLVSIIGSTLSSGFFESVLLIRIVSGIFVSALMPYIIISLAIFYNDISGKNNNITVNYEKEDTIEEKEKDIFEEFYEQ